MISDNFNLNDRISNKAREINTSYNKNKKKQTQNTPKLYNKTSDSGFKVQREKINTFLNQSKNSLNNSFNKSIESSRS